MIHEITHYLKAGPLCEVVVRADTIISEGDTVNIKNFEHSKTPVFSGVVKEIIERRSASGDYTIPHDFIKFSTN